MEVLKPAFLDTARHYAQLGEHGRQYASLLTFAALDRGDVFTIGDVAEATRALPPGGLLEASQALVIALEGAGDQRAEYWSNRIAPYLHAIWPRTRHNISNAIAESLGRLCIAAHDKFPDAFAVLRVWLQPLSDADYLVHLLHEAGLCSRFPELTLDFLGLLIGERTQWPPSKLGACLDAIQTAAPETAVDQRFERLTTYLRLRRRGQG
jgi:hypothetical protein